MIKSFHCYEHDNFRYGDDEVRSFLYTDYSIEPHSHDFYEMNIILGGSGIHKIEAAEYKVSRGDVFVIPPSAIHAYTSTEELAVHHILLRKSFIESEEDASGFPGFLQLMEIEPALRQSYGEAMNLHLDSKELMELEMELSDIADGSRFDKKSYTPIKRHSVWRIIFKLSYLFSLRISDKKRVPGMRYERQMLDTLEYIHSHYSEELTTAELAGRVFLSRSTFLRSFTALSGASPAEYIRAYRRKKARELIGAGKLSKTEIAHLCGFYDLSHMERVLRTPEKG